MGDSIMINREQFAKCTGNLVRNTLFCKLTYACDQNYNLNVSLRQLAADLPRRSRNKRRIGRTLRWMEREKIIVLQHPLKIKGFNSIKVTNHYDGV